MVHVSVRMCTLHPCSACLLMMYRTRPTERIGMGVWNYARTRHVVGVGVMRWGRAVGKGVKGGLGAGRGCLVLTFM